MTNHIVLFRTLWRAFTAFVLVLTCAAALPGSRVAGERASERGDLPAHLVIEPDTLVITVPHGDTATSRVVIRNTARDRAVEITEIGIAYGGNFSLPEPPSLPLRLRPGEEATIVVRFQSQFDRVVFLGDLEVQTTEMPVYQSFWLPLRARRLSTQRVDALWDSLLAYRAALERGDCSNALRRLVNLAPSTGNALEADLLTSRARQHGIHPIALGRCGDAFDPSLLEVARWPIGAWLPRRTPHPLTRDVKPIELVVPEFPREARAAGAFGQLLAAITVGWSGEVTEVTITERRRSHRTELLREAVRRAAQASRFDPAAIRGITVGQVYYHSYFFPPPVSVHLTLDKSRAPLGDTVSARAVFQSDVRIHVQAHLSSAAGYVPDPADHSDWDTWFRDGGFLGGYRFREWRGELEPGVPLIMHARFVSHECLSDTIRAFYYAEHDVIEASCLEGYAIGTTQVVPADADRKPCCFFGPRKRPQQEEAMVPRRGILIATPAGQEDTTSTKVIMVPAPPPAPPVVSSGTFDPRRRTFHADATMEEDRPTDDPCCVDSH